MTTKLISLNEYRKNISSLWKDAREKNIKYVVLSHSQAIFEVKPIFGNEIESWDTEYTEKDHLAYLEAKKEMEKGETTKINFEKIKTEEDFFNLIK